MKTPTHSIVIALLATLVSCTPNASSEVATDVSPSDSSTSGTDSSSSSASGVDSGDADDSPPPPTSTSTGHSSSGDSGEACSDSGGGSGSSSGDDEDPTGTTCLANTDCAAEEVCASSACVDAWAVPHATRVLTWNEVCDGAGTNQFFVEVGFFTSANVGCPQGWPEDWFTVAAGGAAVAFDFYELGGAPNPDQFITTWCWDSGFGCGPIPKVALHAGQATVTWDAWQAELDFVVIE